jgi:hypothetical protein
VRDSIVAAQARGAAILLTVPTNGYVAADKNGGGDVNQTPNYLQVRFEESLPSKGAPFTLMPDAGDGFVYQDEFVNWVDHEFPDSGAGSAHPVFFSLDNEPDLWPDTHPRIHPDATTYAELAAKSIAYATAIKNVSPAALVFGPVNYGWYGYVALQGAPDAAGRDFQEFWLAEIEAAQQLFGARLVDVLDVHWYPEAQGGGVRITGTETTPAVVAARLQAPRSLWDPTYTETSWIAQDSVGGPIALLPRLQDKIDTNAPGTKLAVTEYNYGGGQHISGGIAQADVLGIFGREGVFAANEWPLAGDESYIEAAFEMYRNFDGANGRFGDTSVRANTDDIAGTSVYASLDSADATRMVLVVLNKTALPQNASLDIASPASCAGRVHQLSAGVASLVRAADRAGGANHFPTRCRPGVSTLPLPCRTPRSERRDAAGRAAVLGRAITARRRRGVCGRGSDWRGERIDRPHAARRQRSRVRSAASKLHRLFAQQCVEELLGAFGVAARSSPSPRGASVLAQASSNSGAFLRTRRCARAARWRGSPALAPRWASCELSLAASAPGGRPCSPCRATDRPAFSACTSSPSPGTLTTTVVCAMRATSSSSWPTPTVSSSTTSKPAASSTRAAPCVAEARPPRCPRVAIERMKTPGSSVWRCMRRRSPSSAPPE